LQYGIIWKIRYITAKARRNIRFCFEKQRDFQKKDAFPLSLSVHCVGDKKKEISLENDRMKAKGGYILWKH